MIVQDAPYDLVILFADADAQAFVEPVVERGQARRCIREIRWRSIRDPRRDTVWRAPDASLRPFLQHADCRFVVVWDHEGSGREGDPAEQQEESVVRALVQGGARRENVAAIAFVPELEAAFEPVFERVLEIVAEVRGAKGIPDQFALRLARAGETAAQALARCRSERPKELFEAGLQALRLRRPPGLYRHVGSLVSVDRLKCGDALRRLTVALTTWFPPDPGSGVAGA